DIMIAKRRLERLFKPGEFSILPLAAGLPLKEQQRIFEETGPRKIVLSTNVAETSLTIPGITGVIDPGFAKLAAHAPWSGMPTLEVKRISQASAVQRGGRAGRTHSGVVYRLYSKPEFLNRDAFTPPDIRRIDLSHVLLDVMNLGYSPDLMQWLEPPDEKNLDSALQLLTLLGAMTGEGDITPLGKKLSVFPIHPRLSAVALHGIETGCGEDALLAACLISERFALKNDVTPPGEDEEGEPCDISMQIDLLKSALHKKPNLSGYPLRFLDNRRQKRILELYRTLARVCKLHDVPPYKTDPKKLSRCLLRGYADRVAQRRDINRKRRDIKSKRPKGASALYNFCLGRGGFMGKNSFVLNEQPKFLIAIDAVESPKQDAAKGVSIRACSSLPLDVLNDDPGKMMRSEKREEFDPKDGCLAVFQDLFYGKLKIGSKKTGVLEEGGNLAPALAQNWPYPFENDEPMTIYHSKVELLSKYGIPHNCPVFSGEMLELFFECICEGIRSLKDLKKNSLDFYIYQQLSEFDRAVLKAYTPDEIKLGNGKSLKIHYQSGKEPWGEIFLQDCYGLKKTPAIMQGKQRVILHLLGPSRRAAQVTGDLAGFWKGAYIEVHKELSRRYPKHYWPNNPAGAEPVRLKKWVT
ncbi:MAG: ATP-dependent RNA helicase, partial [bacterium]|nr:ATP-dependent RNA helicase [bacterium]